MDDSHYVPEICGGCLAMKKLLGLTQSPLMKKPTFPARPIMIKELFLSRRDWLTNPNFPMGLSQNRVSRSLGGQL